MRDSFHRQIIECETTIAMMAEQVTAALRRATAALLANDLSAAREVILGDDTVDEARDRCERHTFSVLALQAPVAGDLRRIVTVVHAAGTLERMGDIAAHVARTACRRHPEAVLPEPLVGPISTLATRSVELGDRVVELLRTRDALAAAAFEQTDHTVDRHNREIYALLDNNWPHGVVAAVDVAHLSRHFERFADHAVSLARRTVFAVTGDRHSDHVT